MNLNNTEIKLKLIIPIIIIILFFRIPADNNYTKPKLFPDIAINIPEINTHPSLQYEKHSLSTMLVEITGALAKKGKERS